MQDEKWWEWLLRQKIACGSKLAVVLGTIGLPITRAYELVEVVPIRPGMEGLESGELLGKELTPEKFEELISTLSSLYYESPVDKVAGLVELAVARKEEILRSPNAPLSLVNTVADNVIDRVAGKPTQMIETRSLNVNAEVKDITRLRGELDIILRRLERDDQARQKIVDREAINV